MTKVRHRSILSELMGEAPASALERTVDNTRSVAQRKAAPLYRKRTPDVTLSGAYVTAQDSRYAELLLSYDPNNDFVGADVFRAQGPSGSFVLWTTVPVDHESGKNALRDYDVPLAEPSFYYAIFFDDLVRFSERSPVCTVQYQADIPSSSLPPTSGVVQVVSTYEDAGTGNTMVLCNWSQPFGRTEQPSVYLIKDLSGAILGRSTEITQPIALSQPPKEIHIEALDSLGQPITVAGRQTTLKTAALNFDYLLQELQGLTISCEYNQGVIAIGIEHDSMLAQGVDNVTVLRRNLTTCEKSYVKPDSSWKQNNVVLVKGQHTTLQDRTVRDNDNYEYKVAGYDVAGTQKAVAIRKVFYKAPVALSQMQPTTKMGSKR